MAADLTGIENVGEFFSQHYLDELLLGDLGDLRKSWKDQAAKSPPDALRSCAQPFFRAVGEADKLTRPSVLYEAGHDVQVRIAEALGYAYQPGAFLALADKRVLPLLHRIDRHGEPYLVVVEGRFHEEASAVLDAALVDAQLPSAVAAEYTLAKEPLGKLVAEAFALEEPPRWMVVIAGRDVFLAERARWGRGRHLRFNLSEVLGRRDSQALAITAALLCRDALAPGEGTPIHDALDENSHKHAYGVSSDLKYAARKAVELIGNEYVWYTRETRKKKLYGEHEARELTEECLTYLYRLLFLFYAEARHAELRSLPMDSEEFRLGYSLEALRELEMTPLTTQEAQDGYFMHESLTRLFALVNDGFHESWAQQQLPSGDDARYLERGFTVQGVHSPLFDPKSTPRLSAVKFRNHVLQEVIQLLSLSKERRRGKSAWGRGRISYAQLGINQLGAVYEGLLSYSGFFAKDTLYEVHKAGERKVDETQQAFFVPESDLDRYSEEELTFEDEDGNETRRVYPPATFIFRLAGRDRETSASYYTPEVLTQCLVKYALKVLLDGGMDPEQADEDGFKPKTADEILQLTVCEPAMGSGAFLVEAIDQLAEAYLERKQKELGLTIEPDKYGYEKQRVKAHIAAHNCYGVDLNPMAARLGGVSLWLATMHEGQEAPWYDARLSVGNSLVGARLEVWDASDLETDEPLKKALTKVLKKYGKSSSLEKEVERVLALADKTAVDAVKEVRDAFEEHRRELAARAEDTERDDGEGAKQKVQDQETLAKRLKKAIGDFSLPRHHRKPPRKVAAADVIAGKRSKGSIYHFLLPDAGMSPFDSDKAIKGLVPDDVGRLKVWRKKLTAKYAKGDAARLAAISDRIDQLYARYVDDRAAVLERNRANTPTWGQAAPSPPAGGWHRIGDRVRLLAALRADGGAYDRLRRVMNLWAAQWAWPLQESERLPTRSAWWTEVKRALDIEPSNMPSLDDQLSLLRSTPPSGDSEPPRAASRSLESIAAEVAMRVHPHHWELEAPETFSQRGGFDLVVGNPPWIKLQWNEQGILGDIDPRVVLDDSNAHEMAGRRAAVVGESSLSVYLDAFASEEGYKSVLNGASTYPLLKGIQTNLYKCFLVQSWRTSNELGVTAMVHQQGVFDDPRGGRLRRFLYPRLRHVYRFQNEWPLFSDVLHTRQFCFSVTRSRPSTVSFFASANLFHPTTIQASWAHDGVGSVPGIKTDNNKFEVRGHRSRLVRMEESELALFASLFDEPGTPLLEARLPVVHSREVLAVLAKLDRHPRKLNDLGDQVFGTEMWHETNAQKDGTLRRETRCPGQLPQGRHHHIYVANPFYKTPRKVCRKHHDYDVIDLVGLSDKYLPRTNFVPSCALEEYERRCPLYANRSVTAGYRHVHRRRTTVTAERSVACAILPPGAGHINTVYSLSFRSLRDLVATNSLWNTLLVDFQFRALGKGDFRGDVARGLPIHCAASRVLAAATGRGLRLNCLTSLYADLWLQCECDWSDSEWSIEDARLSPWDFDRRRWSPNVALRNPFERRWALVELDCLGAMELAVTIDELCAIYHTQFPVLRKHEDGTWYDRRGSIVFTVNAQGLPGVGLDRKAFELWQGCLESGDPLPDDFDTQGFEPLVGEDGKPYFDRRDREADMRHAYKVFSERLGLGADGDKGQTPARDAKPRARA